jgi:putative RNA 2'-phosphotransferase
LEAGGIKVSDARLVKLSKLLSLILRHEPGRFGITLDPEGYASLEDVLVALRTRYADARETDILAVVNTVEPEKQRFSVSDGEIRANYGHSLEDRISHERAKPPAILLHGTTISAGLKIRSLGILPMNRQYVHLTTDAALAARIGARRGPPQVIEVDAGRAHDEGVDFFRANPVFWLAETIPARYLKMSTGVGTAP